MTSTRPMCLSSNAIGTRRTPSRIEKAARRPLLKDESNLYQVALQEPGRYLVCMAVPVVPGPQIHVATKPPGVGAVQPAKVVAPALEQGAKVTVPLMPVPRFWEVIVTNPAVVVTIEATYLLVEVADSQPQPPAAGRVVDDCTVSVIEVRHDDPARISSETLALTV